MRRDPKLLNDWCVSAAMAIAGLVFYSLIALLTIATATALLDIIFN